MVNYYKVLEVEKTASLEEIKKAYRRKALKHHPDRGGDAGKFREVQEAYETLSDNEKRRQYDSMSHEDYQESVRASGYRYEQPSWEDLMGFFGRFMKEDVSTETPFDKHFGSQGYPNGYMGGEGFENSETGDLYTSAQDIRIAKMERASLKFKNIMERVKEAMDILEYTPKKLYEMLATFSGEKWISRQKYLEYLEDIERYEKKLPELIAGEEKRRELDEYEEQWGEEFEKGKNREGGKAVAENRSRAAIGRENKVRPKRGRNHDQRKQWKRELSESWKPR